MTHPIGVTRPLCRYCPLLDKTGKITCTYIKEMFNTMTNVSCRSSNLIYCITCKTCNIQYVGQTRRQIQARFAGHFNDVLNSLSHKPVSAHFSQRTHRGTKDFLIHILIEFIRKPPKSTQAGNIMLRCETHWMNTLRTHHWPQLRRPKRVQRLQRLNTLGIQTISPPL